MSSVLSSVGSLARGPICEMTYRALNADDAAAYKRVRMKALTGEDARFFTADPKKEGAYSLNDWKAACAETCKHVVLGAFSGKELVGIMAVSHFEKDPTGKTAYYGAAYVLPEFRHASLTKELVLMQDLWAKEHGYEKASFTIKKDNVEWFQRQVSHGAEVKEEFDAFFADGTTAPICRLERPLGRPTL